MHSFARGTIKRQLDWYTWLFSGVEYRQIFLLSIPHETWNFHCLREKYCKRIIIWTHISWSLSLFVDVVVVVVKNCFTYLIDCYISSCRKMNLYISQFIIFPRWTIKWRAHLPTRNVFYDTRIGKKKIYIFLSHTSTIK